MSKRWKSKPCPGVDDFAKMNRTGESVEQYYSRTQFGTDGYYSTYHTLARKYGWPHEPKKPELPAGASRSFSTILNTEKERLETQIGDCNVVINRYGKDDSKVQVLIHNLRTGNSVAESMPMSKVDAFIKTHTE